MLGVRIASLRRESGWSQSELARRLGVSASAVGMYEQGRREPSAQMLIELSRAFQVSVDYLLMGSAPEPAISKDLEQSLLDRIAAADARLNTRKERPFSREELAVLLAAMLVEE